MSYLMMAVGDGDSNLLGAVTEACEPHMTKAGATSVRPAVLMTGANTGKGLISSVWDSAENYFFNRANWLADPKVVEAFQSAGITSN